MKLSDIHIEPLLDTLRLEDISDNEYFSEKFSNFISNSRLKYINPEEGGCPEDFFERRPMQRSDSLIFGGAVHTLTLQPDDFILIDKVNRPTAKAGYMADYIYDKYIGPCGDNVGEVIGALEDNCFIEASDEIDYYKGSMNDKKINALKEKCVDYWTDRAIFEQDYKDSKVPIYLDLKSIDKLQRCLTALGKDQEIQSLLHPEGLLSKPIIGNEKTILLDIKVTAPENEPFILRLKAKLDNFSLDKESNIITVNDLKTTGKFVTEFDGAVTQYHYYREIALYSWLLNFCAKKFYDMNNCTIKGNFLVVETIPDYYTKVVPMTKSLYLKGIKEFLHLIRLVAYYVMHGYESFGTKLL